MGGSKKKARPLKKVRMTVPTHFDCPFCNHNKTVECKLNRQTNVGTIHCRICDAKYSMTINYLSNPIDVFSEWIDECEKRNRSEAGVGRSDSKDDDTSGGDAVSAAAAADSKDQKSDSKSAAAKAKPAAKAAAGSAAGAKKKPAAKPVSAGSKRKAENSDSEGEDISHVKVDDEAHDSADDGDYDPSKPEAGVGFGEDDD